MTLPVAITNLQLPVRLKGDIVIMPWPVLLPSSFLRFMLDKSTGHVLLGGHALEEAALWKGAFCEFWRRCERTHPSHPVFQDHRACLSNCIPILLHGDEGRGKLRRAVMCISWQPLLKAQGHSFRSRMLVGILPGEKYAGDVSLDMMHDAVCADLLTLYQEGMSVPWLQFARYVCVCVYCSVHVSIACLMIRLPCPMGRVRNCSWSLWGPREIGYI